MPEAGPRKDAPQNDTPVRSAPRKRGMFDDPMVRKMVFITFGLVIVFLVTALSAIFTGVVGRTGPRSFAEKQVAVAGAAVGEGTKDPTVIGDYVAALIASGQYSRAQREITSAKKSLDDSATAEFTLAEARLLSAQDKYEESIRAGERALKQINADYQAKLKVGGEVTRVAKNDGLHENYFETVLLIAYAHRELKQWDKAITSFDVYLGRFSDAADILVDRGNAKAASGDKKGAEADFRTALKYIPDSQEALDGLSKIGVAR